MASITHSKGKRTIQVVCPDGKRRPIRLGKCDGRTAEGVKLHVERLIEARLSGMPIHNDTAMWLRDIGDDLYHRIVRVGLCSGRSASMRGMIPLEKMLDDYIARRTDLKEWSIKMLRQARDKLVTHFGADRLIGTITVADAADFKRQVGKGVSVAYVAKLVLLSRQFFKDAVESEILDKSPFAKIKAGSQKNPARQRFITAQIIDRAIEAAPDIEWKLIIAFARYGGLRIPSEVLALRWTDVHWDAGRIVIHASKTEHHVGKGRREIPLFAELKPLLLEAFEQAPDGSTYVMGCLRDPAVNLRTQFQRILERAGIEPWPKLFQNLRSSRQTELTERWPAHVVCAWMGNSEVVARDHYLQITDEHFVEAARSGEKDNHDGEKSGAKSGAAHAGFGLHDDASDIFHQSASSDVTKSCEQERACSEKCKITCMGAEGFEPSKA
jgi:integrase